MEEKGDGASAAISRRALHAPGAAGRCWRAGGCRGCRRRARWPRGWPQPGTQQGRRPLCAQAGCPRGPRGSGTSTGPLCGSSFTEPGLRGLQERGTPRTPSCTGRGAAGGELGSVPGVGRLGRAQETPGCPQPSTGAQGAEGRLRALQAAPPQRSSGVTSGGRAKPPGNKTGAGAGSQRGVSGSSAVPCSCGLPGTRRLHLALPAGQRWGTVPKAGHHGSCGKPGVLRSLGAGTIAGTKCLCFN